MCIQFFNIEISNPRTGLSKLSVFLIKLNDLLNIINTLPYFLKKNHKMHAFNILIASSHISLKSGCGMQDLHDGGV